MAGYFMWIKIEEMATIALPGVSNPLLDLKRHLIASDNLKRCNKGATFFAHLLKISGSGMSPGNFDS